MNNEQIIQEATEAVEKGLPCAYLVPHLLEVAKNQKLEIEILIRKKEALRDEIAEKDAEIERLKEEVEHFKLKNSELFKLNKNVADAAESLQADKIIAQRHEKDARELYKQAVLQLKTVKSEAYREFAEKVKTKKFTHKNFGELVYVEDIDTTLNELTRNLHGKQ